MPAGLKALKVGCRAIRRHFGGRGIPLNLTLL
jgi:hypothetical protein